MKYLSRNTVSLLLALSASALLTAQSRQDLRDAIANAPRNVPWTEDNVHAKELFNSGSDKIDPALLAVASAVKSKGIDDLETTAKEFSVQTDGDMVAVQLIAEDEADVAKLRREVSQRGGRVTTTYKGQVFAFLPPSEIASLGKVDELYAAVRPEMFYASEQDDEKGLPLVDGVMKIRADRLHKAGITGKGVKVGLLDFGFQKYAEEQAAGLVPAPAEAKAFTKSGQLDVNTQHGTACAEIIHAMAPDAQIYVAAVDGQVDQIILAARWLKAQGVDIISFSGGGHGGPHDGTSVMDQLVEEMSRDKHLLWVNAAGNEGAKHFRVEVPAGASGWIRVNQKADFIAFSPKVKAISLTVNWDDWGSDPNHPSGTQDIDVVLYHYNQSTQGIEQVYQSQTRQNGRLPPIEVISGEVPAGEIFLLKLRAVNVTKPLHVHVFSNLPALMEPVDPTGSIGIPATSLSALAVGAVDVTNDKLEPYSSRGPTDDNRAKPELSSYDNVSSAAYGQNGAPGRFTGTSAACPHVSGLAALFKSQGQVNDATALRGRLMANLRHPAQNDPGFGTGVTDVGTPTDDARTRTPGGPPTTSGLLDLPGVLGGKVNAESLDELRQSRSDQPFQVKVRLGRDGNPPEYQIGDDLRLGFTTAEDSYCTLINRDAEGEYTVLPLESERLEGGRKYVYPDKIRVTAPTGSEEFMFICAKERVNLNNWRRLADQGLVSVDIARYEVK